MRSETYRGIEIRNRTGKAHDYFVSGGNRVRWGTLDECKADADHFLEWGHFPARSPNSWA